jgi:pre-60S factor REI1
LGDPVPARRESVDSDAELEFNDIVSGLHKAKISRDEQRPSPVKRPANPKPATAEDTDEAPDAANGRESNSATPVQAEPAWSLKSCIFCNYTSPTVPLNVHHMERFHGMFIPEKPYLVDLDGLIDQLQRKVHEDHECLFCSKIKSTVFGLQTHMRDKGHCKIPFTTEDEQLAIGDFYDFRSTYSDDEEESDEEEEANGGAKLGARRAAKVTNADGEDVDAGQGDGWETDSSASSLDSEDLTAVPAEGHIHQYERLDRHPHHSSHDPRARHQADGWHSRAHKHTHAVFYDDYELHLPSGKSVGHRSMNKYYKQNLYNYPTPEERAERKAIEDGEERHVSDDERDNRLAVTNGRSRAVVPRGAAGMEGVSDKARQLVKRSEERGRTMEDNYAKKKDYAYGLKLNKQKGYYYRYTRGG